MIVSGIFNFFERLAARFKRREHQRIRRLEADLAQARLVLGFYSRRENYPSFTVVGQQHSILADRGERARRALAASTSAAMSWSVFRDDEGTVQPERRTVVPA